MPSSRVSGLGSCRSRAAGPSGSSARRCHPLPALRHSLRARSKPLAACPPQPDAAARRPALPGEHPRQEPHGTSVDRASYGLPLAGTGQPPRRVSRSNPDAVAQGGTTRFQIPGPPRLHVSHRNGREERSAFGENCGRFAFSEVHRCTSRAPATASTRAIWAPGSGDRYRSLPGCAYSTRASCSQ